MTGHKDTAARDIERILREDGVDWLGWALVLLPTLVVIAALAIAFLPSLQGVWNVWR